ncbi:MAG: cation transporter [Actinobacteria bacterium]|nr:cation transporter [Actinomycetota bacterium]
MGHDHDHSHVDLGAGRRNLGRLVFVTVIIALFCVVEVVTAYTTNSLAMLSDAGHMLTDLVGLTMAIAAITLADRHARRGETGSHTYGLYRLEIVAAFCNALLLFAVALYVLVEAIRRLSSKPEILTTPMLVVAVAGLVVNIGAFFILRDGRSESLNVEGAALEVLADLVSSIGVIIAAVVLKVFGWTWADAVIGVGIGVWILPRATRLGGRALRILLQSAPRGVDPDRLRSELAGLPGVIDVHDLHVWTLTSGMDTATVHLMVDPSSDTHAVLDQARELLKTRYEIGHATLQVEPADHQGCDEVGW